VHDPWFSLRSGPGDAAHNMALDEALLSAAQRLGRPVWRSYGWRQPAATLGYFQRHAEIATLTPLRPLVRRPTGGGLVPHDRDWTYSVVVPPGHAWYALRAEESYRRVHVWLRDAFARLGVPTELAGCCDTTGHGQCFVGAEKHDLLHCGRKIAGAAQRRNRQGLLIQGSVQPPPGPNRDAWEEAMRAVATEQWKAAWAELNLDPELTAEAARLTAEKYALPSYNEKK